jgi:O-antigen ligase
MVGVLFLNATFRNRFLSTFDLTNISNSDRLTIWRANYEIFKNNWLFGVGINANNSMVQAEYLKLGLPRPQLMDVHHAHSDLIHIFTGTGIIGGSLYLLMLVSFLYFTYALYVHFKERNDFLCRISLGLFLAQLFFHLGGLFQCNYTDREVNHLLMFIWFAVTSLYLYYKEPTAAFSKL